MMSPRFEASLSEVEQLLGGMSALLVQGDAPALETASTALRQAMVDLSNATSTEPPRVLQQAAVRSRLARVSQDLVRQREQLARRSVLVDRTLASVLPMEASATYGTGKPGAFKTSSARIYAAAAN